MSPDFPVFHTVESVKMPINPSPKTFSPDIKMSMLELITVCLLSRTKYWLEN